ncbi:MAG: DMT family transporter [Pseudorhodoplanes sp.]|nr:DMT family transporter [Pseudorhodoplanes sp.]
MPRAVLIGSLCGAGAALSWAIGFVTAKYGLSNGMTPADLAFHRFAWSGLLLLPFLAREGVSDLGGLGWGRGIVLMILGGPTQALLAYTGFTLVPLGHGTVIQPGMASLSGLILAAVFLHESLRPARILGAIGIVLGLITLGAESLLTIGTHGVGGDLMFACAGFFWAVFSILLRYWSVPGTRAAMIVAVLALLFYVPLHGIVFGYRQLLEAGLGMNVLQALVQGGLAGVIPIYLFTRAIMLLGAGRASLFTALVPVSSVILGALLIREIPTWPQIAGLVIVLIGFRLAVRQ